MKKIIIIGTAIVLGLIGLMLWGWNSQISGIPQNSGTVSSLTTPEKLYNFGTISMKNGLVSRIFKVVNSSDKDIYVKKINTSCMCARAAGTQKEKEAKERTLRPNIDSP